MANFKFVKSATALVLGASVLTSAVVVPGTNASAKTTYKVTKKGTLVNAKTNKTVKGYASYKGKLYKDGKVFTGLYSKKYYYKNGVKATGTYAGAYYYKGSKKVTTGTYNGAYYYKGIKKVTTGTYNNAYYVKGVKKVTTGTYNGAYYVNGVKKVTTGTYNKAYYENGKKVVSTGLYKEKYYKDGVLNVGLALFEGKLYNDADLNKGLKKFEEKFYFDADLANGTYDDNGVEKAFENGVEVGAKVKSVEAINAKELKITFNKSLDADTAEVIGNYVLDGTDLAAATGSVELSEDKKSVVITLATALTKDTSYKVAVKNSVTDLAGNKVAAFETLYKFTDTVAPKVESTNYFAADAKYVIKFSEPVNPSITSLVKVLDKNNAEVSTASAALSTDGKTLTITSSAALTANDTYKVVILGATDLTGNYFENNRIESSFKVAKTDEVAPTVASLEAKDAQTVRVTFSEPVLVDASSILGTISLDGAAATNVKSVTTPAAAGEAKDVNGDGKTWDVLVSTSAISGVKKVTIAGVKDLQGNAIASAYDKFVTFAADTKAPSVVSTKTVGSKLYLTLDEDAATLTAGSVTVLTPDNVEKTVSVTPTFSGSNKKVVILDLGSTISKSGSYKVSVPATMIKDAAGNGKAYTSTDSYSVGNDTVAPTLKLNAGGTAVDATAVVQNAANPSEFTLTFSEEMGQSALDINNYTLNGKKVFKSAVFVGDTKTVKLTANADAIDVTGKYLVGITNVADLAGNVISPVSYEEDASVVENVTPKIKEAKLKDASTITLNFTENVTTTATNYVEVYVNGAKVATTISAITGAATADITLTSALTDTNAVVTVKVVDGTSILDGNSNAFVTGQTYTVTK
ncbi:Ig-like domain-containing protein [Rummeliibacillus pycnus]|uniref:Ig-like domain-containing protein n=1 Tax=Rummeliibacillus pycnus TaxID=101070 RepID=UPI003D2E20F2